MGRNIPSREIVTSSIPPIVSLAICVTWIAAMVTTILSLCGIWSKKSSKSSKGNSKTTPVITTTDLTTDAAQSSPSSSKGKNTNFVDNNATTTTNTVNDDDDVTSRPLPPPPSAAKLEFGESAVIKNIDKSYSLKNYKPKTRRKLTSSISLKMSMKIKDKASDFKDKASEFKDKATEFGHRKVKNDNESLWTKRIILGEKCKLPNDEDEVVFSYDDGEEEEEKNKTAKFTRAISRSLSSIDTDSISGLRDEEKLV